MSVLNSSFPCIFSRLLLAFALNARVRRKMKWKCVESECFSLMLSDTKEAERAGGLNEGSQTVCMCLCVCGLSADWALSLLASNFTCWSKLNLIKNSSVWSLAWEDKHFNHKFNKWLWFSDFHWIGGNGTSFNPHMLGFFLLSFYHFLEDHLQQWKSINLSIYKTIFLCALS